MIKLRVPLLALPLLLLLASIGRAEPVQADFFVATTGSDAWSGKLPSPNADKTDGPFASIPRALDALKASSTRGGTILLRAGSYRLEKTLDLYPPNSGTDTHPLVIAGYPGEKVEIDGSMPISGAWTKVGAGPLWSIKPGGLAHPVEDIFYQGQRQTCARLPDQGWWPAGDVNQSHNQFSFEAGRLKAWPDISSADVVIKTHEWLDETLPVKSIDEATHTVTTAKNGEYPLVPNTSWEKGQYYIENVRAALDRPGTWCFNHDSGELLFWPPDGNDPSNQVVAGGLPVLFSLSGDMKAGTWTEHVLVENLTFVRTGRFVEWRYYNGAAVRFCHCVRSCEVRHCLFQGPGRLRRDSV